MKHGFRYAGRVRAHALAAFAFVLTLGLGATGCRIERIDAPGVEDQDADFEARVEEILQLSADAWNTGNLEGFMVHYERAPTTTYIGSSGLLVGYDAIHGRYAPDFEPAAARDSLRFESIRTRRLEQRFGIATARYVLYRDGQTTSTGPFTLVLMQVEGAWKIIHDQSAADPPPERESGSAAEEEGGAAGTV
jgi:hypothetical protein